MADLTQTGAQVQTDLNAIEDSNMGLDSITDGSDTQSTAAKKSGVHSLGATSSNAPTTDRAVMLTLARDADAASELRHAQVVITEPGNMYWAEENNGTLGNWQRVVSEDATQTLTNKTLTSPDINGGTIDGTVIGGATPAAVSGTTGSFSGNIEARSGQTIVKNGASGSPSVAFDSEQTLGFFRDSAGVIGFTGSLKPQSGNGVDFSNTADGSATATSELWDDYEEGDWVPVYVDGTLSGAESQTFDIQVGEYTKNGDEVDLYFRCRATGLGTLTTTDTAGVIGFPYAASSTGNLFGTINIGFAAGLNITGGESVTGLIQTGNFFGQFYKWDSATGTSALTVAELSASGDLIGTGFYKAA